MTTGFQLRVFSLQWPDLGYRYTTPEIWPTLLEAFATEPAFLIEETDLRVYDWKNQEIWLTAATVARLEAAGGEKLLNHAVGRVFVVALDAEPLYGGLFYHSGGAAAIRFPVIHPLGKPISVLRIRPALGANWTPEKPYLAAQSAAIANPRILARLTERGLIGSPPAGVALPDR